MATCPWCRRPRCLPPHAAPASTRTEPSEQPAVAQAPPPGPARPAAAARSAPERTWGALPLLAPWLGRRRAWTGCVRSSPVDRGCACSSATRDRPPPPRWLGPPRRQRLRRRASVRCWRQPLGITHRPLQRPPRRRVQVEVAVAEVSQSACRRRQPRWRWLPLTATAVGRWMQALLQS